MPIALGCQAFSAADAFFNAKRDQIVSLAACYGIPAICEQHAFKFRLPTG
jgi:hypothetical protein